MRDDSHFQKQDFERFGSMVRSLDPRQKESGDAFEILVYRTRRELSTRDFEYFCEDVFDALVERALLRVLREMWVPGCFYGRNRNFICPIVLQ